ncbi:hypothetical protein JW859_06445 [bacterium]|nr:hypothetical protein [bacterium]
MITTERYLDVVVAAKRHAAGLGFDTTVEYSPRDNGEPYVISIRDVTDSSRHGLLMVFPPEEFMLTSEGIGFIIKQIKRAEDLSGRSILLFCDCTYPLVRKVLQASGIENHATVALYETSDRNFAMDWSLDN